MFKSQLLIAGQMRAAEHQATFTRHNPANGELASQAAAASVDDAKAAAQAAQAAFPAWAASLPAERRRLLLKAADIMESYTAQFVALGQAEAGGVAAWYHFNVALAAGMLREAAGMTTQIGGELIPSDIPGSLAMGVRQPCGVVLGIAPWNAPVILATRAIAMPLACGNTVILKASETCPALHSLIGQVFMEAGFPAGVVNVLTHGPADAAAIVNTLIAHPAVRRINFTGSTRIGRLIAQQAASHLKPVLLELGGKNPFIVLDDADLDAAVEAAAFSAFFNQGQICMSTERLVLDHQIADTFIEKLLAKIHTLPAGLPNQAGAVLGGMVDASAVQHVKTLVEEAVSLGAKLLTGPLQANGNILQPVLLDHLTPAMRLYHEEAFGPVASILRFENDQQALAIANDSEYGLSAAIFSRNTSRAMALAGQIESGICHINGPTVHDEAQMPFGGMKNSGYGRFGSRAAIHEFTELRWITLQQTARHYPI